MFKATFWWNFALIVFFLITVSLGVTLYVFYQMNAETLMHLQELSDEQAIKNGELMVKQNELEEFRKKIDGEETKKTVQELVDDHAAVMKKYAENFTKSNQSYSSILAYLFNQMQVQNFTLDANQQDTLDLTAFNENRTKYNSIAMDSVKKHAAMFTEDKNVYAKALAEIEADLNKQKNDLDKLVKAAGSSNDAIINELNTSLAKTNEEIKIQMGKNIKQRQQLAQNNTRVAERPNGQIQFISAAQGKATINLGSADHIPLSASFSVYSRSETDMKNGKQKGSIQVSQITGLHSADCIVTSDNPSDPILPGDKIYSPVIGERHFAIAGFIDMDKNGINDVEQLVQILEANGGVVDGYQIDEKQVRRLEETTDFLIIGQRPDENSSEGIRNTFTNFTKDADAFNTPQIDLKDLLQEMGIRPDKSAVIQGGVDTRPIPYTKSNYSGGNVSGLFMEEHNNPVDEKDDKDGNNNNDKE